MAGTPSAKTANIAVRGIQGFLVTISPSPALAAVIYGWANVGFIFSLVLGIACTVLLVWMGGIKENDLKAQVAASNAVAELAKDGAAKANEGAAKANEGAANAQSDAASATLAAAQANARAAQLEKEAAEARLETEKLKQVVAWRKLTPAQMGTLVAALSEGPMSLSLSAASDPEALTLGRQLIQGFVRAGLVVTAFNRRMDPPVLNTDALVSGRPPDVMRMQRALEAAGLTVTPAAADSNLDVLIGSKPRP